MSIEQLRQYDRIDQFRLRGHTYGVRFAGSTAVAEGVVCDMYAFDDDYNRDLGIIKIQPGCRTPLQRVVGGIYTLEGYVAGRGRLLLGATVTGISHEYPVPDNGSEPFDRLVGIGRTMQWVADPNEPLIASEVCYPPYADGRFENLDL